MEAPRPAGAGDLIYSLGFTTIVFSRQLSGQYGVACVPPVLSSPAQCLVRFCTPSNSRGDSGLAGMHSSVPPSGGDRGPDPDPSGRPPARVPSLRAQSDSGFEQPPEPAPHSASRCTCARALVRNRLPVSAQATRVATCVPCLSLVPSPPPSAAPGAHCLKLDCCPRPSSPHHTGWRFPELRRKGCSRVVFCDCPCSSGWRA